MKVKYKKITHKQFVKYIDEICLRLVNYLDKNNLRVDYVCPIIRSGAVPAVYIANRLNIIKFAPIQVKHIKYKNGETGVTKIFSAFDSLKIEKASPVFLVVDGTHASGESAKTCIDEIHKKYKDAKIIYICLFKKYKSQDFKDITIYEDFVKYYKGANYYTKKECKDLNIEYYYPLYPWEVEEQILKHDDDLEESIYF